MTDDEKLDLLLEASEHNQVGLTMDHIYHLSKGLELEAFQSFIKNALNMPEYMTSNLAYSRTVGEGNAN